MFLLKVVLNLSLLAAYAYFGNQIFRAKLIFVTFWLLSISWQNLKKLAQKKFIMAACLNNIGYLRLDTLEFHELFFASSDFDC